MNPLVIINLTLLGWLWPFSGGDSGNLDPKDAQIDSIDMPTGEEKIIVRSVGASDKKLYKNKPGARSKTELGSAEFTKPVADVSKSSQPIPVEYGDILR